MIPERHATTAIDPRRLQHGRRERGQAGQPGENRGQSTGGSFPRIDLFAFPEQASRCGGVCRPPGGQPARRAPSAADLPPDRGAVREAHLRRPSVRPRDALGTLGRRLPLGDQQLRPRLGLDRLRRPPDLRPPDVRRSKLTTLLWALQPRHRSRRSRSRRAHALERRMEWMVNPRQLTVPVPSTVRRTGSNHGTSNRSRPAMLGMTAVVTTGPDLARRVPGRVVGRELGRRKSSPR